MSNCVVTFASLDDHAACITILEAVDEDKILDQFHYGNALFIVAKTQVRIMANVVTSEASSIDHEAIKTAIEAIDDLKYIETTIVGAAAIISQRTNPLGISTEPTATVTTTNATITSLKTLTLTDEKVYHIRISVLARERDGSDQNLYHLEGLFYRTGAGNATQQGATTSITTIESEVNCACVFDVNGNDVRVRVTGVAAETWDWSCVLEFKLAGSLAQVEQWLKQLES